MGGLAWHHLQYVRGLADLGHEVYYFEDSGDSPFCCYDPSRHVTDADTSYGLSFASDCFARLGLGDLWAYYDAHTERWLGPNSPRALQLCATADVLLNVSGVNPIRPWFAEIDRRGLVDTDPVFTQIDHLTDSAARARALQHTSFFSYAENIGHSSCSVPDDGIPWISTRQPIVLTAWPVTPGPVSGKFTTVMQWDSYAEREYGGRRYGMKSRSFGECIDLPSRIDATFELAIGRAPDHLETKGWHVQNPLQLMPDPWAYQRYIQGSKAEFSVAKHGYVITHSGWFSERSAAYLASGRPVVVQNTGFPDWMATGAGVFAFDAPEEAVAAVKEVNARYDHHCKAAREIAEEYFSASDVLTSLLSSISEPIRAARDA